MEANKEIDRSEQLKEIRNYVENLFHDDSSDHDFSHMERVAKMATYIAQKESANCFICEATEGFMMLETLSFLRIHKKASKIWRLF